MRGSSVVGATTETAMLEMAEAHLHRLVAGVDGRHDGCEPASIIIPEIYKELALSISTAPDIDVFAFWSVGNKGRRHVRVLDGKEIVIVLHDMYHETDNPRGVYYDEFTVEQGQRPKRTAVVSYMTGGKMSAGEQALYQELRASGLGPDAARVTVAVHGQYATTSVGDYVGAGRHVRTVEEITRASR